jgi:hypothetical protein
MDAERELKRLREERRLTRERKYKIRAEVGWVTYYFNKDSRDKAAGGYPLPVVCLDDKGEVKVRWRHTLNDDDT